MSSPSKKQPAAAAKDTPRICKQGDNPIVGPQEKQLRLLPVKGPHQTHYAASFALP